MDNQRQRKLQEEKAEREFYLINFEGKNSPLVLPTVSVVCTQQIKFQSKFETSERLCDLLLFLRGQLKLKDNESVALTHIKMEVVCQNGTTAIVRRQLPCMEYDEDEDIDLGGGGVSVDDQSTMSEEEVWGLDPTLELAAVKYFSNNCTVMFVVNEKIEFVFPPLVNENKKMPSGQLVKHLRESMKARRRRQNKK